MLSNCLPNLIKRHAPDVSRTLDVSRCRAFSTIDSISLITLSGTHLNDVPGVASRLFEAVHRVDCSVVMISQASSEHSICFAVVSKDAIKVCKAVRAAFFREFHEEGATIQVDVESNCTIICAVGQQMNGSMGILGLLASSLAKCDVNIKAICQGCSEMNITFVVASSQATAGLSAMHQAVYGSPTPTPAISNQKENGEAISVVLLVDAVTTSLNGAPIMDQLVAYLESTQDARSSSKATIFAYTDGSTYCLKTEELKETPPVKAAGELINLLQVGSLLVDLRTSAEGTPPSPKTAINNFLTSWKNSGKLHVTRTHIHGAQAVTGIMNVLRGGGMGKKPKRRSRKSNVHSPATPHEGPAGSPSDAPTDEPAPIISGPAEVPNGGPATVGEMSNSEGQSAQVAPVATDV